MTAIKARAGAPPSMVSMATTPMTPVDAAWYHMDSPANPAVVTGILLFKTPLDFAKVRAVYAERIVEFERFRQRVVERGLAIATPHWEDADDFNIDRHVHHLALPEPCDAAALTTLVNDIASAPLDHGLPLWHVYVVDGVDGGSALLMRYHHCIGDGTAMMTVTRRLFDTHPRAPLKAAPVTAAAPAPRAGLLDSAFDLVTHPQRVVAQAATVLEGAGMLVNELLKWPDPPSPLKGEFGVGKHVAWSQPVAISDVKAIGASSGAKVNDVLVAAMTGALRSYLQQRGIDVDHTTVRAMVPVDLRPPERLGRLGNEFGLVILDLAVARATPAQRLATTKARMDALKRSPEAVAMQLLLDIFGRGPKPLEDLANQVFGSKASVVMTNVAGPAQTLYLAGTAIDRMTFFVPHPGQQLGMGISILSYKGMATLAVISDARLVPDPQTITAQFNREFATMLRRVKVNAARREARKAVAQRAP
jgi:WS/DGAT/MGAT family acyltransferase